jgi:hypothetical protein
VPSSGPTGTQVTISGTNFVPYAAYQICWDSQATLIQAVLADDIGQIANLVYTVPAAATVGIHQILATEDNGRVVAQVPFTVTQ